MEYSYEEFDEDFVRKNKEVYMLTSIAIILLLGLLMGWLFSKLKLPSFPNEIASLGYVINKETSGNEYSFTMKAGENNGSVI